MLSLRQFCDKVLIEDLFLPSLQKLDISYLQPWAYHLPKLCPSLEDLKVWDIGTGAELKDLIFVLSNCSELKNVSISMMFQYRDCTNDVLEGLQKFGHLIVDLDGDGYLRHVTTQGFKNLLKCCTRMRKVRFIHFDDNGALLMSVAQTCPLLDDIKFDSCSKAALLELSQNCKQLRKVHICRYTPELAAVSAVEFGVLNLIDTLEELHLRNCGLADETLAVITGFRHVKDLVLKEAFGIEGLTGAGFRVLEGSAISETLQRISVSFAEGGDYARPVPDFDIAGMMAGIASCHNLREASLLHHCDDAGLVALGAGCPLLKEITLTYGPVTVDGLVALAEHCKHLTDVLLAYDEYEGRDWNSDYKYLDGSECGPGNARAKADAPMIKSRLPHIRFHWVILE